MISNMVELIRGSGVRISLVHKICVGLSLRLRLSIRLSLKLSRIIILTRHLNSMRRCVPSISLTCNL